MTDAKVPFTTNTPRPGEAPGARVDRFPDGFPPNMKTDGTLPIRDRGKMLPPGANHPINELLRGIADNPKKAFGDMKPSIHFVPMGVMLDVAKVMATGAAKYGRMNWRKQPIKASTYYSAMFRHMQSWFDGEDIDPESGQPHLAHAICCAMLVLDSQKLEILVDDRKDTEVLTGGVGE